MKKTFSKEILFDRTPRVFKRDATEVRFLLGGIGTGNFSVNSRGKFLDWEIFNWPSKNTKFPLSFFAIRTENKELERPISKILESRMVPPYTSSHGYLQAELVNLPRMEDSELICEYPFARVNFKDSELPVKVSMEAYTPFIPLNTDDSSIPCAIIRYTVKNIADCPTKPALVPDMPYDNDKNGGCFSGSVVVQDNQLFLFYTGRTEDETGIFETQNLAVSKDGRHFVKIEENPLINEVPEKGGRDFRDPKVFFAQGKWRMICGGSTGRIEHPESRGRIYLFSSTDLYHWTYSGILYEAEPGEGRMFECPDAFCLDDVWFLTASPMYEKDSATTLYLSGQVDFDKCEFHKKISGTLDLGTHYYAAQTYPVLNGEIRSVAWLGGWLWMPWIRDFGPKEGYRGILDVSRVWYLDDNRRLCAKVADKVKDEMKLFRRTLEKHWTGENIPPQSQPVMVELKGKLPGDGELLCIDLYDTDRHTVTICFDYSKKEMTVNYNRADTASRYGIRTVSCEMMEKETDIDILIDGNTFTLLWEHGLYRYTGKLYPQGNIGVRIMWPLICLCQRSGSC